MAGSGADSARSAGMTNLGEPDDVFLTLLAVVCALVGEFESEPAVGEGEGDDEGVAARFRDMSKDVMLLKESLPEAHLLLLSSWVLTFCTAAAPFFT
jgi:hypothetical protein